LLAATIGAGFVALKQNSAASKWRQQDQSEMALNRTLSTRNDVLSAELVSAHAAIASLNSETSKLRGQIKSLHTRLSSVANAKKGTLRRSSLLSRLDNEAGTVSTELSTCVGDMNSLHAEIDNDLPNLGHSPFLQPDSRNASQVCATALRDNQQLQSTLRATG
jgi:chromosome segregation ATPase